VTGGRSGITGGALFGGTVGLVPEEAQLGRRLAIVRVYYHLGQSFPRASDRLLMAGGRTLLVSLDTVPGRPGYASIAAGRQDAVIGGFLSAVNLAAVRYRLGAIYICFEHEPDVQAHHGGLGSPAQFVSAWDHVHQLAAAAHLNWNQGGRLHWVWIMTHNAFLPLYSQPKYAWRAAASFWPGTSEVDIIGVDGYDAYGCRLAQGRLRAARSEATLTPASVYGAAVGFAQQVGGLPVFIGEWGSATSAARVQSAFIRRMQAYLTRNREIAAALYWNEAGPNCSFVINTIAPSVSALAAMGQAVALRGQVRAAAGQPLRATTKSQSASNAARAETSGRARI
jgi:hypothetical protein